MPSTAGAPEEPLGQNHQSSEQEEIELQDLAAQAAPQPTNGSSLSYDSERKPWHIRLRFLIPHAIAVDQAACRDHFALERTFLAYIRTSNAIAQLGVALAWLFRINFTLNGTADPRSLVIGKALGVTTVCLALVVAVCGALFFATQQNGIVRGTIVARSGLDWVVLGLTMAVGDMPFCGRARTCVVSG